MIILLFASCTLISDADVADKVGESDRPRSDDQSDADTGSDSDADGDADADTDADGDADADGDTDTDSDSDADTDSDTDTEVDEDEDDDGIPVDDDCDDADASVGAAAVWYGDGDGDGFGNPAVSVSACSQPEGFAADNTDCDDADAAVNPSVVEVCNGLDDDCNGDVDTDSIDGGIVATPTAITFHAYDGGQDQLVELTGCATGIYDELDYWDSYSSWMGFTDYPTSVNGTDTLTVSYVGEGGLSTGYVQKLVLGTDQGDIEFWLTIVVP